MEVIINIASKKALMKLRDEGVEALTLIGEDGRKYELRVDGNGALAISVKKDSAGGNSDAQLAFGVKCGKLSDYSAFPPCSAVQLVVSDPGSAGSCPKGDRVSDKALQMPQTGARAD